MKTGVAVFDANPLIAFHQIGQIVLVRELFRRILVPITVALEVAPSLGALAHWIELQDDFAVPAMSRSLDAVEKAAIALVIEISADFVVLDDLAGRLAAIDLGLTAIGSLGLLVRAKRAGLLGKVRPMMDALIANGLYASEHLYRQILVLAREE